MVPLLVADGETMSDTGFALQYLAERYPEPRLAPTEPAACYDLQAWSGWLGGAMGLAGNVRLLGWNRVMLRAMPENELANFRARVAALPKEKQSGWAAVWSDAEADEDQFANAEDRVQQLVGRMEPLLADSGWLVGGAYSIADMEAYAHMHNLPELLPGIVNRRNSPKVMDWLALIAARPATMAAISMRRSTIAPVLYAAPGC
jgi:glutathione S-transferase